MDYINHETKEQVSLYDIKAKYINSSFPNSPREELLKSMGYYLIHEGKVPEYDTYYQKSEYDGVVYNNKLDIYERKYIIKDIDISELIKSKIVQIDNETSKEILNGFSAEINGEIIKFSYDSFDQQNFSDQANLTLNYKINNTLDKEIKWVGYKENTGEQITIIFTVQDFIDFYVNIVVEHKMILLEKAKTRKKAIMIENIDPKVLQYI